MQFDWQEYINNTEQFWQTTEIFVRGLKSHKMPTNKLAFYEDKSRQYMQDCIRDSELFLKNFSKNGGGGKTIFILSPVEASTILTRLKESFGVQNIWLYDNKNTNDIDRLEKDLSLSIQFCDKQYDIEFANVFADELDCMSVLQDAVVKAYFEKGIDRDFYTQLKDTLWLTQKDKLLAHIASRQQFLNKLNTEHTLTDDAVANLSQSIHVYLTCEKKFPNTTTHQALGACNEVLEAILEDMEEYTYLRKNAKALQKNLADIANNMRQDDVLESAQTLQMTRK